VSSSTDAVILPAENEKPTGRSNAGEGAALWHVGHLLTSSSCVNAVASHTDVRICLADHEIIAATARELISA
jgi:hypothetical protein